MFLKALSVNEKIRLAFVFGSVARGKEKVGSDVDLVIIGIKQHFTGVNENQKK